MSKLTAKQVLKNKYWIVEQEGTKIANIQAVDDGGFVYVYGENRRRYPSIKLLSMEHNVYFEKSIIDGSKHSNSEFSVYGYPTICKPQNPLWNLKHRFPVFTKTKKSKSYFCAGHYLIKFNEVWIKSFCPKLITLNRYDFKGPFKSEQELNLNLG